MKNGLGRPRNGVIAALDVGSSKTCCFVAAIEDGARPCVLGIGQQASRGVRNGNVIDMEDCEAAILNAVHAAEQMAGATIDRVLVNLSGGHPASTSIAVQVSIAGHDVGDSDLRRALQHGRQVNGGNGAVIHGRQVVCRQLHTHRLGAIRDLRSIAGTGYGEGIGLIAINQDEGGVNFSDLFNACFNRVNKAHLVGVHAFKDGAA